MLTCQLADILQLLAHANTPGQARAALSTMKEALADAEHGASVASALQRLVERVEEVHQLRELAGTDELTGAANRRGFTDALERELARRLRGGPEVGVILIDLDGLKPLNDTHGHAAGDEAIRITAQACKETVRSTDMVARLGGDELAILIVGCSDTEAEILAERVRRAIESHIVAGVGLRTSIGAATTTSCEPCAGALLAAADSRMYRDKNARKRHRHVRPAPALAAVAA